MSLLSAITRRCSRYWTARRRRNSITRMHSRSTTPWSIIPVTIRRCSTKVRPIRLKRTTPNCAIIWHVWPVNLAVFRVAYTPYTKPSSSLSSPGIVASSISKPFRAIRPLSEISHTRDSCHSSKAIQLDPKLTGAYVNRSYSQFRQDDYDNALADAKEALRLNPKSADAYHTRGRIRYAKGER